MTQRPRRVRVNLRQTHPLIYWPATAVGAGMLVLALNFWYYTPAFEPYSIPKDVVGLVWFVLGLVQLVTLNFISDLSRLRAALLTSISLTLAWGIANTQQAFDGPASLQLPITFLIICAMQIPLAIFLPVREREP